MRTFLLAATLSSVLLTTACATKPPVDQAARQAVPKPPPVDSETAPGLKWGRLVGTIQGPVTQTATATTFALDAGGRVVPMKSVSPLPLHAMDGAKVRVEAGASDGEFVAVTTMTVTSAAFAEQLLVTLNRHGFNLVLSVGPARLSNYLDETDLTAMTAGYSPESGGFPPVWVSECANQQVPALTEAWKEFGPVTVYRYKSFIVVVAKDRLAAEQVRALESVVGEPIAP